MDNKWCEHMVYVSKPVHDDMPGYYLIGRSDIYQHPYCYICGTPRPKEKSLEEKLAEHLYNNTYHKNLSMESALVVAKASVSFLESEGYHK